MRMAKRRQFLRYTIVGMVGPIAGCVETGGDGTDVVTAANGGNGGTGTGTMTGTGNATANRTANGTANGTGTATGTDTETDTPEPTPTATPGPPAAGTWPAFARDHQNTGFSNVAGPSGGFIDWRTEVASTVAACPVVSSDGIFVGGLDGRLHALDAGGNSRWSHNTGTAIASTAAVRDGVVMVANNDGVITAVDAVSGDELWRFEAIGTIRTALNATPYRHYFGAEDAGIYAVPRGARGFDWRYETGGAVRSTPAIDSGKVVAGSDDRRVYGLAVDDGARDWFHVADGSVRSSPAIADGTVYIGDDRGTLWALDLFTGSEQWSVSLGGPLRTSPAIGENVVVLGNDNGRAFCVNRDGSVRWEAVLSDDPLVSPGIADGVAYVPGSSLWALDLASGDELWDVSPTGNEIGDSVAIANGVAYVADDSGVVNAIGN